MKLYYIDDLELEVVYNSDDIIFQVTYLDKLFQDKILLSDITKNNGYFDDIKKVEILIENCINKKNDNYKIKYNLDKNFELIFEYINTDDSLYLFLSFKLTQIRKDISINENIIELKKEISMLHEKLSLFDNFYCHDNLLEMVNFRGHQIVSFSNDFIKNPVYLMRTHEGFLSPNMNRVRVPGFDYHYLFGLNSPEYLNYVKYRPTEHLDGLLAQIVNYKVINPTKKFMTEDFISLECDVLILKGLKNINFEFIPKTVKYIFLIECKFDNLNSLSNENSLECIVIFKCVFKDLVILSEYEKKLNLYFFGCNKEIDIKSYKKNLIINQELIPKC